MHIGQPVIASLKSEGQLRTVAFVGEADFDSVLTGYALPRDNVGGEFAIGGDQVVAGLPINPVGNQRQAG